MLTSNEEALMVIMEAIRPQATLPAKEWPWPSTPLPPEFYKGSKYVFEAEGKSRTAEGVIDYYIELVDKYPIISIEDGLAEDDWDGWRLFTEAGEKAADRRGRPLCYQYGTLEQGDQERGWPTPY